MRHASGMCQVMLAGAFLVHATGAMALGDLSATPRVLESKIHDSASPSSPGVGSSLEEVRSAFGDPVEEMDGTCFCTNSDSEVFDGIAKTLQYEGMRISLVKYGAETEYRASMISLMKTTYWVTPGIEVGMEDEDLLAKLGEPDEVGQDGATGSRILHYGYDHGRTDLRIHMDGSKIKTIELMSLACPKTAG
jgi:hypothetical protein